MIFTIIRLKMQCFTFHNFSQTFWNAFSGQFSSNVTKISSKLCWMTYIVSKNSLTSAFLVLFGSQITSKPFTLEKNKLDFRNLRPQKWLYMNWQSSMTEFQILQLFIFDVRLSGSINRGGCIVSTDEELWSAFLS